MTERPKVVAVRAKVLIVAIVVSIFWMILNIYSNGFTCFTPTCLMGSQLMYGSGYEWAIVQEMRAPLYYFFALVPFVFFAAMPKRLRLTAAEMTIVYSMIMTVSLYGTWYGIYPPMFMVPSAFPQGEPWVTYMTEDAPALWGPTDTKVLEGFYYGGKPVPWNAWTIPVLYWVSLWIAFQMMGLFVISLMRKMWVDIEALPFPMSIGASEMVLSAAEEGRPNLLRNKWLWTGFILGSVLEIGYVINFYYPAIPLFHLMIDLSTLNLLAWAPLVISFLPFHIGTGLLTPSDVIISFVIFGILFHWIIPSAAAGVGLIPPGTPGQSYSSVGWTTGWGWANTPFKFYSNAIWGGATFALAIWPMIVHRRHVADVVRAVFKKPSAEFEAPEPMSYRMMMMGAIIFGILFCGLWIAAGAPGPFVFLTTLMLVFGWIGISRAIAEGGGFAGTVGQYHTFTANNTAWMIGTTVQGWSGTGFHNEIFPAMGFVHGITNDTYSAITVNPIINSPQLYKIGDLTSTRSKDIFKAQAISLIVGTAICIPLLITLMYTYGGVTKFGYTQLTAQGGWWYANEALSQGRGTLTFIGPGGDPDASTAGWFILGVALTIGLYVTRARFPRLRIHPVGVWLGSWWGITIAPMIFPWIIALVLKYVVLTIGGVRLYEGRLIPIAVGLIASFGFIIFLQWWPMMMVGFRAAA